MPKTAAACALACLLMAGTAYAGAPLKGVGHKDADRTACGAMTDRTGDCPKSTTATAPQNTPAPQPGKTSG